MKNKVKKATAKKRDAAKKRYVTKKRDAVRTAAYSGLILLILVFLSGLFYKLFSLGGEALLMGYGVVYHIVILVLSILFLMGFIFLGKKFKLKLLVVISWIGIIINIILFLFLMSTTLYGGSIENYFNETLMDINDTIMEHVSLNEATGAVSYDQLPQEAKDFFTKMIIIFVSIYISVSVILGLYAILFGVALIKISKKAKYAKVAGILNIVAGATFFIFIGYLVYFVAFIFELVMLFKIPKNIK